MSHFAIWLLICDNNNKQHEKLILNIIVSILNLVNIFALSKTNRKNNLQMVIAQLDIVCRVENVKF